MDTAQRSDAPTEPIDAVQARLADAGVLARPLREVLALLAEGSRPLEDLVRRPAVPRRTVEELLRAAGDDVELVAGAYRLTPDARDRYRERFALDELRETPPPSGKTLELLREFIASGPTPIAALDHVTATPETVLRRAEWLRDHFDLRGARVLCLGDHDLTSLAVGLVEPSASVRVVDLDDRILAHIDTLASAHRLAVRALHADVRFGLPPTLEKWADVVFTDPPYTPEGIALFARRAAECLAGPNSRVLLAYGFSSRGPALGHKVQQELLRLGFVFEAIIPDFHRYFGAQAIGSASDLYVCQPTAHTRKLALREATGIYTHGPQSIEAQAAAAPPELLQGVSERVGGSVSELRAPGWSRPIEARHGVDVFDLRDDPGPWLARMLLACNAERAGFLIGNNHPDITSNAAQQALIDLVGPKFTLRFHRSTPDSAHALVVAETVKAATAEHFLLRRAHGKVGNVAREALIAAFEGQLTKRQAADRVAALAPAPSDLRVRLIDLPRHRVLSLLQALGHSGHTASP